MMAAEISNLSYYLHRLCNYITGLLIYSTFVLCAACLKLLPVALKWPYRSF